MHLHHWVWYTLDSTTRKAIDHILISLYWWSCLRYCRVYQDAQLGKTDHRLITAQLRINL